MINLEVKRAKMGKVRDALQQAKGEFAEQNRMEQEKRAKKGVSDDEFANYSNKLLESAFGFTGTVS